MPVVTTYSLGMNRCPDCHHTLDQHAGKRRDDGGYDWGCTWCETCRRSYAAAELAAFLGRAPLGAAS